MQEVRRNFLKLAFLFASLLLTVTSCSFFQPTAQFFIINESQDRPAVDIVITFGGHTIFNNKIRYSDIRPDLQYTPYKTFSKGKYMITVTADSGKVQVKQPIMLDGDRFIFVTYSYKKPSDSATLVKRFGYAFPDMLKGKVPNVGIFITDKEPIHM